MRLDFNAFKMIKPVIRKEHQVANSNDVKPRKRNISQIILATLKASGSMDVSQLVLLSGVSVTAVYRTLGLLEGKGAVVISKEKGSTGVTKTFVNLGV